MWAVVAALESNRRVRICLNVGPHNFVLGVDSIARFMRLLGPVWRFKCSYAAPIQSE
jgi:hypothetical protein